MRHLLWFIAAFAAALPLRAAEVTPQATPAARVITLEEAYDISLATDQTIGQDYWKIRQATCCRGRR